MEEKVVYAVNIENIIKKRGIKMKDFFTAAGLSSSTYYKSKTANRFSTKVLEDIAHVLKVSIAELVTSHKTKDDIQKKEDFEKIKESIKNFEDKHII